MEKKDILYDAYKRSSKTMKELFIEEQTEKMNHLLVQIENFKHEKDEAKAKQLFAEIKSKLRDGVVEEVEELQNEVSNKLVEALSERNKKIKDAIRIAAMLDKDAHFMWKSDKDFPATEFYNGVDGKLRMSVDITFSDYYVEGTDAFEQNLFAYKDNSLYKDLMVQVMTALREKGAPHYIALFGNADSDYNIVQFINDNVKEFQELANKTAEKEELKSVMNILKVVDDDYQKSLNYLKKTLKQYEGMDEVIKIFSKDATLYEAIIKVKMYERYIEAVNKALENEGAPLLSTWEHKGYDFATQQLLNSLKHYVAEQNKYIVSTISNLEFVANKRGINYTPAVCGMQNNNMVTLELKNADNSDLQKRKVSIIFENEPNFSLKSDLFLSKYEFEISNPFYDANSNLVPFNVKMETMEPTVKKFYDKIVRVIEENPNFKTKEKSNIKKDFDEACTCICDEIPPIISAEIMSNRECFETQINKDIDYIENELKKQKKRNDKITNNEYER